MLTPRDVSISLWSTTVGLLGGVGLAALSWFVADLTGTDAVLAFVTSGLTGASLGLAVGVVAAVLVGPPPPDPSSRCPDCRYPTRGLDRDRCPECGAAHA